MNLEIIKPKKLNKGDTIALISPSAGLASIFPHRLDNAIKALNNLGFKTKEFSCTRNIKEWSAGSAEERARNIMEAFLDEDIKAIICTIGGNTANQTLEHLNFKKIKENSKIFCGYSDISILHYAFLTQSNLTTFYGPCAMTQFGEYPRPLNYTIKYFLKALTSDTAMGSIESSEEWTDEVLDWKQKLDLTRSRKMQKNKGFEWLREGRARGPIIGGCLHSIVHLRGTKFWPNHKNTILFLEIPEGQDFSKGEPLAEVDAMLGDLKLSGVFDLISGLIVGRPFRYNEKETCTFKQVILENTKEYDFPILYGVDIGHTDPQITIPLRTEVEIDSKKNNFRFIESGVT